MPCIRQVCGRASAGYVRDVRETPGGRIAWRPSCACRAGTETAPPTLEAPYLVGLARWPNSGCGPLGQRYDPLCLRSSARHCAQPLQARIHLSRRPSFRDGWTNRPVRCVLLSARAPVASSQRPQHRHRHHTCPSIPSVNRSSFHERALSGIRQTPTECQWIHCGGQGAFPGTGRAGIRGDEPAAGQEWRIRTQLPARVCRPAQIHKARLEKLSKTSRVYVDT